jgi:hypothetical protein
MRFEFLLVAVLLAQSDSAGVTLSVNLGSYARLSMAPTAMTFPDANPDLVPFVAAVPPTINVTARTRTTRGAQVILTAQPTGDLRAGLLTIPASMLRWTGTGAGFVPGTLATGSNVTVGSWTGSGVRAGTQSYQFENRWSHPPGTYSVTIVYTLSSP